MSDTLKPTDSVLRRHWEASHAMSGASASSSQQNSSMGAGANSNASSSGNNASEGGFFGWLKRLFS